MKFNPKKLTTSIGYSFAFAALCSLALAPQAALADDESESSKEASTGESAAASTGKRVYSAPVAKEKSETVYVFANPDGSVKNTEVSTTLKNPLGEKELADSSDLTDIENTEGENTFSGSGDGMVWDTLGKDVYYMGNTSKEAPVSVKISYFLDGQKVSYEKLAGASGKLKIRFDYENNATVNAQINGKEETLYVPFTFITAMLFDNDSFKNAEVVNGRIIDDGDRLIVAGYAVPGLQKSLGSIAKDFDIPDYFEVTADVTDFELKTSLTIATAGLMEGFDTSDLDTSELKDASSELTDAMGKILDGTGDLKSGLDKLASGAKSAKVASGKLAAGADKLAGGADELSKGVGTMKDSTAALPDGVKALADGSSSLANALPDAADGAGKLVNGTDALESGLEQLKAGLQAAVDATGQLIAGTQQLEGRIGQTKTKLVDLKDKLSEAEEAAEKIATGSGKLSQAIEGSSQTVGSVANKLNELAGNSTTMSEDEQDALKKAATTLNALTGDTDQAYNTIVSSGLSDIKTGATAIQGGAQQGVAALEEATKEGGSIDQLYGGAQQLERGLTKLKSGDGSTSNGLEGAIAALGDKATKDTLIFGAAVIEDGLSQLNTGLNQAAAGAGQLSSGLEELNGKVPALVEGINTVAGGAEQVAQGSNKLADSLHQYDDGLGALKSGTQAAADGTGTLLDGLQTFNDEGVSEISDRIDNDILPFADRLDAITAAAKDYNNFAGITEGTKGSVKFIIETDGISAEE